MNIYIYEKFLYMYKHAWKKEEIDAKKTKKKDNNHIWNDKLE